ncbi:MAG TPA: Xaa-Pro peptidase family protein [Nakamurella sp.]|nr:Xaa-Pro peptidase family protein [Nakamurella sp.]
MTGTPSEFAARRQALSAKMSDAGVDLLFLPPSADLEYLTGLERRVPAFGNVSYAHHWVTGALIAPGADPIFILPRMVTEFDLPGGVTGEVITVNETDDAVDIVASALKRFNHVRRIAFGNRTWAQTVIEVTELCRPDATVAAEPLINPLRRIKSEVELGWMVKACQVVDQVMADIEGKVVAGVTELDLASEVAHLMKVAGSRTESFDTGVWSMGPLDDRDATVRVSTQPLRPGMAVSFDFGAVLGGYCSDFGRTVHIGEPNEEFLRVHELVTAAQQAGIDAVQPGVTAAQVHAATRKVIVDGGYGDWFRHRTGHCIGLDVHELPYISEEDHTPLESGMTFTIEPSVFWPGRVGARVEDIILCTENGGRRLNEHPITLAVSA